MSTVWALHHEDAEGMVSCLLRCVTTWLSRIAGWCVSGETPWDQPWPLVLTLPHVRDGLRVLLMAMLRNVRTLSISCAARCAI
jgi:hypothetical protein